MMIAAGNHFFGSSFAVGFALRPVELSSFLENGKLTDISYDAFFFGRVDKIGQKNESSIK